MSAPGPWKVEGPVVKGSDGSNVSGLVVKRMSSDVLRLVVAAPDLLAACKELMRTWGDDTDLTDVVAMTRAAIAKAEGRER